MFDLTTVQIVQLIGGLFLGVLAFLIAYVSPARVVVSFLIITIPFQLIESRYGTSNMVITYLVGAAFFLRGMFRRLPFFGSVLAILIAYLASISQVSRAAFMEHAIYIVGLGSGFIAFYIVYNYARDIKNVTSLVNILLVLNGLIVIYCLVQLLAGYERVSVGTEEISLNVNRDTQRLVGPFYAVGLTAECLVIMIFVCAFQLIYEKRRLVRWALYALTGANMGFLIATANRGGFLVLLGGGLLFLYLYRRELGIYRIITYVTMGVVALSVMSFIILKYTDFNRLYERLEQTEFEGGMPDTRSGGWSSAWEAIKERPLIGHGPRLRLYMDDIKKIPGHTYIPYPHNLYLYLLCTVGIAGLTAFITFIARIIIRLGFAIRRKTQDAYLNGLVKLGLLITVVFLVDQIKMEFLRFSLLDYQHFIFMLMAIIVAIVDIARERYVNEKKLLKTATS